MCLLSPAQPNTTGQNLRLFWTAQAVSAADRSDEFLIPPLPFLLPRERPARPAPSRAQTFGALAWAREKLHQVAFFMASTPFPSPGALASPAAPRLHALVAGGEEAGSSPCPHETFGKFLTMRILLFFPLQFLTSLPHGHSSIQQ